MFENLQSSISKECREADCQGESGTWGKGRSVNSEAVPVLVGWYQVELFSSLLAL